jgi:hypothetical protein
MALDSGIPAGITAISKDMAENNFPNLQQPPFALSLSKGRSWFDKALLSVVEGLRTNGKSGR